MNRITKESRTSSPAPNPISSDEAGTTPLTQFTNTTGAVWNGEFEPNTATVAPVSLMLRVKAIIAPDRMEYFVKGRTIVVKTLNGFAPNVLAASSRSRLTRSKAADIDFTM